MTIGDRIKEAREAKGIGQSELGRLVGVSPQAVQQWETPGGTAPRGKRIAAIADALGVDKSWLQFGDEKKPGVQLVLQGGGPSELWSRVEEISKSYGIAGPSVAVPVFDAVASMGLGRPQPDHETVIGALQLSEEWVRRNLAVSSTKNLASLTAYGDSMAPTFADGDILLVDCGVSDIRLDAVYVIALNQELFIKRVQRRMDGSVVIKSDNPLYDPHIVSNGERDSLQILGRVLWAWNGRKL